MENYKEENYLEAKQKVKNVKGLYLHIFIFVLVNAMLIFFKIKGDNHVKINQYFTIVVWGVFLVMHGLRIFLPDILFGKDWEKRKIRKILDKNKKL